MENPAPCPPFHRIALIALVAFACLSASAQAQFFQQAPPQPGSYEGYWNPNHTPPGFHARMGQVTFRNRGNDRIDLYHVDRHGRWNWAARLSPGSSKTITSPIGDYWAAHDRWGKVIQRTQVLRRPQIVDIRISGYYPPPGRPDIDRNRVDLTFRNQRSRDVDLYSLDRHGRWTWAARVRERGGEVRVRAFNRQEWKAVDSRRQKTVKTYTAGRRNDTVVIN